MKNCNCLVQIVEDDAQEEVEAVQESQEEVEAVQESQEETVENGTDKSVPVISNILISIDEVDEKGNIIKQEVVEIQETKELPPSDEPPLILT